MRSHRWSLAAFVWVVVAVSGLRADEPRRFVVALRPRVDRAAIEAVLVRAGLRLEPPLWADARGSVHTALAVAPFDTAAAFRALDALRGEGNAIAGGDLLEQRAGFVRFYSGRVLVRFRKLVAEAGARAWGRPLGMSLRRMARDGSWFVFEAPLDPRSLLAVTSDAVDEGVELTPLVHDLSRRPAVVARPGPAVYHRIPAQRNKLVILLDSRPDAAYEQFLADNQGTVVSGAGTTRQIVQFRDEEAMMVAQALSRSVDSVRRVGPLLSARPLAFLTNELVVRYASPKAAQTAVPEWYKLQESRELGYVENGFTYRLPLASYDVYDIARELIVNGHALFAVPNVATFAESACHSTACQGDPHLEYLRMIDACVPREAAPESEVVVGILDEGIQAETLPLIADRVHVGTAIDFDTMQRCHPSDPASWWSDAACANVLRPGGSSWNVSGHGNEMALLAAADCDNAELLGVAPEVSLINARRPDYGDRAREWTDLAFADALWWLAGGDPVWSRDCTNYPCDVMPCDPAQPAACTGPALPARLDSNHRASVINLSFVREDFGEQHCPDLETCRLVCATAPEQCGAVQVVLERIRTPEADDGVRDGGAVVLAAAGIENSIGGAGSKLCFDSSGQMTGEAGNPLTDLAESPWTIAVGSVLPTQPMGSDPPTGAPFYLDSGDRCLINFGGSFLDVVAPLGMSTELCTACGYQGIKPVTSGESSAATATVSGVVALMLQQNSNLAAWQVHCILRRTAARHDGASEMWSSTTLAGWTGLDCEFAGDHSNCFGYGMVDAAAAVAAAVGCKNPASPTCPCPPPSPPDFPRPPEAPAAVRRTDVSDLDVGGEQEFKACAMQVPEAWWAAHHECAMGTCPCAVDPVPCFIRTRIRNSTRACVPAATFKICSGGECHGLEGLPVDWAPGEVMAAGISMSPEYLAWVRARVESAEPLELRLFSEGKAVTKRSLARLRKVAGCGPFR